LTTPRTPSGDARPVAQRARAARKRNPQARAQAFARLYPQGPWETPLRTWEFALPSDRTQRPLRRRAR
jgi:hypothetical protein